MGEREISSLAVGDLLMTRSGQMKPIKWIGRQTFHREHGTLWRNEVAPIKVMRSALAEGVPSRDLYLSQAHALYVEDVLIEIGALVNGSTIIRCNADARLSLEYFHLELGDADGVFADGTPSETLTLGVSDDYYKFDNWRERLPLDQHTIPLREAVVTMGARQQVPSRLRSALAPLVDLRTDFDKLRDKIEERGEGLRAAA